MSGTTTFTVSTDAGDLVAWRTGTGPRVLLLHGGPGLSGDYLDGLVDELAVGYEVATFQQRGLSPSTAAGPFTVARAIADVADVLRGLGWQRPLLLGHSWGGHLALHVATAQHVELSGVLALDPLGAVGDGGLAAFNQALTDRASPEDRSRVEELAALPDDQASEADQMELLRLIWPGYFAQRSVATPMPDLRIGTDAAAGLWPDLIARLPELASALRTVDTPMTLVGCSGSPIPAEAVRLTAELSPAARFELLDGVGHFPWLERSGLVRAALDRLARRVHHP
jgi:pimeloyl-ACP methyl ester carboxylesterase